MDTNGDGHISLDDFDDLFNSYGGARMDQNLWENLLMEADKNGDGIVVFEEFQVAMGNILRKTLKKKRAGSHKWMNVDAGTGLRKKHGIKNLPSIISYA